ncbi:MAG: alpha/beta hydrolase [Elusimicrobia bacterium]|nr:alpha/beta hydrolase [Elusimicrobiota bacterium]
MFRKKIIIGIHGIGNKPPKSVLKKWWSKSISDGLRTNGYPVKPFRFDLVYWADYMHPRPLDPRVRDRKDPLYVQRPYTPSSGTPGKFEESSFKKKVHNKIEKKLDRIFFEEHAFINVDKIADMIIRKLFSDLDVYYHKEDIKRPQSASARDSIRNRLARVLRMHRKKDILLIAHSMGSVIAYDVLTRLAPEVKINTMITIGSPLGAPVIMKKILEEQGKDFRQEKTVVSPGNIEHKWYNFADLDDKIAFNYSLADDYSKSPRGIGPVDSIVNNTYEYNGVKNHHKEFGYLRTPEVSRSIHEFLSYGRFDLMDILAKVFSTPAKGDKRRKA